jgi:hypothetical protein
MQMKLFIFLALFPVAIYTHAQVGIGTVTPSPNSALDISSTNKGIMLPRLNDTTNVTNPSEGLMIYNKQMQAPAYHDGTRWNTLAARTTNSAQAIPDSISYTITSPTTGYAAGTLNTINVISTGLSNTYTAGGGGAGRAVFLPVSITKLLDINSIPLIKSIASGFVSGSMVIEFKMFQSGAANPDYSIKLTNPYVLSYNIALDAGGSMVEQATLSGSIVGYKNWITGQNFAWNVSTNAISTY